MNPAKQVEGRKTHPVCYWDTAASTVPCESWPRALNSPPFNYTQILKHNRRSNIPSQTAGAHCRLIRGPWPDQLGFESKTSVRGVKKLLGGRGAPLAPLRYKSLTRLWGSMQKGSCYLCTRGDRVGTLRISTTEVPTPQRAERAGGGCVCTSAHESLKTPKCLREAKRNYEVRT